jgi:hypothetical protein
VLNFALLLERLQVEFYKAGVASGVLSGELADFARVALDHERRHVHAVERTLGPAARPPLPFRLQKVTATAADFTAAAIALEDLAVGAYNGQVGNVSRPVLALAAEIVSVEGRHAAWIRDIAQKEPAPRAADPLYTAAEVVRQLRSLEIVEGL